MLQLITEIIGLFSAALIMIFGLGQGWLAYTYRNSKIQRQPGAHEPKPWSQPWPTVLIQLPIFNEQYVVERLLRCVAETDFPRDKLTIQLLDDSNDETTAIAAKVIAELKATGLNIAHVRRPERKGFKAGALDYGMGLDKAEFIVIFDADFLPRVDFVKRILAYFADPKIGMVQTRWEHLNADYSLVTRMMAFAIDTHFSVEHGGRQASDSFINFNGTGGMWRRKTIEDAGGWRSDTLTEDLDLSFRSQMKGWKFIFTEDITSPSELPVQMSAVRSQQFRWTKGAAETGRKTLGDLWSSRENIVTKIAGSLHMMNSTIFLFLFLFGLASLILPFTGDANFTAVSIIMNVMIFVAMLSTVFTYWVAQRSGDFTWGNRGPFQIVLTTVQFLSLATGLSLHCAGAVIQGLSGKASPFVRTPKHNIMTKADTTKTRKAYNISSVPKVAYFEIILALVFALSFLVAFKTGLSAFMGVYLFYAYGFGMVSFLTLREVLADAGSPH